MLASSSNSRVKVFCSCRSSWQRRWSTLVGDDLPEAGHVDMSFNSWCLLYMLFLVCACAVTPCSFLMLHCSRGAKQAISTPQVRAFRSLVQACTSYDCWWLLYLLSTPTSIRISHVRRRFNGWHEFEGDVCDSGEDDKGAVQVLPPFVAHDDASQEDVDCVDTVSFQRCAN